MGFERLEEIRIQVVGEMVAPVDKPVAAPQKKMVNTRFKFSKPTS